MYENMLIHSERGTYFLGSANPILSETRGRSLPEIRNTEMVALQLLGAMHKGAIQWQLWLSKLRCGEKSGSLEEKNCPRAADE